MLFRSMTVTRIPRDQLELRDNPQGGAQRIATRTQTILEDDESGGAPLSVHCCQRRNDPSVMTESSEREGLLEDRLLLH